MSTIELLAKVEELKELEALIREAEAEAEALKSQIKAEMMRQELDEMCVGRYVIRWTSVTSNRFDSKKFQDAMPEIYMLYVSETKSRRFSIVG